MQPSEPRRSKTVPEGESRIRQLRRQSSNARLREPLPGPGALPPAPVPLVRRNSCTQWRTLAEPVSREASARAPVNREPSSSSEPPQSHSQGVTKAELAMSPAARRPS
eukprot:6172934-Prymnesium_polylepis.1